MGEKRIDISCPHHKGDGYNYEMNGCMLWICGNCNMLLAQELLGQIAVEVFAPKVYGDMLSDVEGDE